MASDSETEKKRILVPASGTRYDSQTTLIQVQSHRALILHMISKDESPHPLDARATPRASDTSAILLIICTLCLIWYTFVAFVSTLGYLQLYVLLLMQWCDGY